MPIHIVTYVRSARPGTPSADFGCAPGPKRANKSVYGGAVSGSFPRLRPAPPSAPRAQPPAADSRADRAITLPSQIVPNDPRANADASFPRPAHAMILIDLRLQRYRQEPFWEKFFGGPASVTHLRLSPVRFDRRVPWLRRVRPRTRPSGTAVLFRPRPLRPGAAPALVCSNERGRPARRHPPTFQTIISLGTWISSSNLGLMAGVSSRRSSARGERRWR